MIFLLTTVLIVLFVTFFSTQIRKPRNYPPGPAFIPIIGHYLRLQKLSRTLGGLHFAYKNLAKTFNTNLLGLKNGNELTVVVHSYPLIKQVNMDDVFTGRPDNFFMRLRSMGTRKGITGTDGELWSIQRAFTVKHLKHLGMGKEIMSKLIKNEVKNLLPILPHSNGQIKNVLSPSVINLFWDLTSGSRISGDDPRIEKLLGLLDRRSKAFNMAGGILNIFPWLRFIAPKQCGYQLIDNMNKELESLFMQTIDEHYKMCSEEKEDDFIYVFIREIKKSTKTFSDDQLVMVLVDLFIAGSQTTSTTLDFALMMMILRPDIQEKLQKYLDEAFDKNEPIDYSERHRVPYVEAVIMEVLRYFLIVPITGPRRTVHDTELGGYTIPKDTAILINLYSMHHDKTYWKDPEEFRPERFIDREGNLFSHDNFLPFGLGKRRCLGESLARNCLFTFFAEIVRKYKITQQPGSEKPSMISQPGLVLTPQPYLAQFTKRHC